MNNTYSFCTLKENKTFHSSNVGWTSWLPKEYNTEKLKTNFTMKILPQLGNKKKLYPEWWHGPVVTTSRRLRQEDHNFKLLRAIKLDNISKKKKKT